MPHLLSISDPFRAPGSPLVFMPARTSPRHRRRFLAGECPAAIAGAAAGPRATVAITARNRAQVSLAAAESGGSPRSHQTTWACPARKLPHAAAIVSTTCNPRPPSSKSPGLRKWGAETPPASQTTILAPPRHRQQPTSTRPPAGPCSSALANNSLTASAASPGSAGPRCGPTARVIQSRTSLP